MKIFSTFCLLIPLLGTCQFIGEPASSMNESDYAHQLSEKTDTIAVHYVAFACECANWLPLEYLDTDTPAEHSIFLEPADTSRQIPSEYYLDTTGNAIRLIGNYYEDLGIGRGYFSPTERKPSKARVFRYRHYEILKPYRKWKGDWSGSVVE